MNSKQRKTLEAIFADPVSPNIVWDDIERLFIGLGCDVIEGRGSRVRFASKGVVGTFHRPHPQKEAKHHHVRDAREFLSKIGAKP